MSTEDAARVFAFAFALGQLAQNLKDLGDRYSDLTGAPSPPAGTAFPG